MDTLPLDRQVDALLEALPPELRERWGQEVANASDEEAVAVLALALERRREARMRASRVEVSPEAIATARRLREALFSNPEKLGAGGVADVLADPGNPGVCYKVVRDRLEYSLVNPITIESRFLEELEDFSHAGIRTPRPYSIIAAGDFVAIGMERLPGLSLEQMHALPALPERFDTAAYFAAMQGYLDAMLRGPGIYHRDIKLGNLMFDPESGGGYVVDFGRAAHAIPEQDGFVEISLGGRAVRIKDANASRLAYCEHELRRRFPQGVAF